jgi:hypothetical protein
MLLLVRSDSGSQPAGRGVGVFFGGVGVLVGFGEGVGRSASSAFLPVFWRCSCAMAPRLCESRRFRTGGVGVRVGSAPIVRTSLSASEKVWPSTVVKTIRPPARRGGSLSRITRPSFSVMIVADGAGVETSKPTTSVRAKQVVTTESKDTP